MRPFIFGYGSLVNRGTHDYAEAHTARLHGWKRAWRRTNLRKVAYLTVVPSKGSLIDGMILQAAHGDNQLDAREYAYERHTVTNAVAHPAQNSGDVQLYSIAEGAHFEPTHENPVLLSYVDVVVQGYLREFGEEGVRNFFETTDGWHAPIHDDREQPIYSRHQSLRADERQLVDDWLKTVGARVER